ncbi:MAG TPA: GNAT family N-acetyltransferase [Acidimicrobiia bacterium]|nr:GNAT family N-acetyltransferase [Acidimicrobiia bacterium]
MRTIRAAAFADVDALTLYRLLRLRVAVFVVEQECAYLELDGRDLEPATVHLWIDDDAGTGEPVAYLRILTEADGTIRLGRVVTAPAHRGEGHAAALVRYALALTAPTAAVLDAQSHLTGWYEELGFEIAGAEYLDDGIRHTPMRLVRAPC